jgi:tRNA (guanine10-N2)-dimethyltransferase
VILAVANAITGRPDLHHPLVNLAVVGVAGVWHFGRIISTGRSHWLRGIDRPVHFSSALPQRFSRALVNLVAAPGDTFIDPCCGIGTPVIEALDAGVIAFGADSNSKMLRGLAENLQHLGMPLRLFRADARHLVGSFDAGVLDLPYGRNLQMDETLYRELLGPLGRSARHIAIVAARDMDELLHDLGYVIVRHARVRKWQLVRHVYVLRGL